VGAPPERRLTFFWAEVRSLARGRRKTGGRTLEVAMEYTTILVVVALVLVVLLLNMIRSG
jgi:hypothetical protein